MSDDFTQDEQARIKAAGKQIVLELGPPRAAEALGVSPREILLVFNGPQPASRALATRVAELRGLNLDDLLAPPNQDRYPNRTEAIAIARREGFADDVIREVQQSRPDTDLSLIDWLMRLRAGQQRFSEVAARPSGPTTVPLVAEPAPLLAAGVAAKTPPAHLTAPIAAPVHRAPEPASATAPSEPPALFSAPSTPNPVVTITRRESVAQDAPPAAVVGSSGIPGVQGEQTAILQAIATGEPALPLLEYASLSMGLELLPHRLDDVFNHFGLRTEVARENETRAWTARLEANSREKREWEAARLRSRNYWVRFDRPEIAPPLPPLPPVTPEPISPSSQVYSQAEPSAPAPVTPPPYAPPPAPVAPPVVPPAAPPLVASSGPRVVGGGTDVYEAIVEAPSMHASGAGPTLSLEAYASISAEVHAAPARAEEIFARHGLIDPAARNAVNAAWQERLRESPGDQWEFQRLYALRLAALEREARRSNAPPSMPVPRVAPPPPMPMKTYAQMVVELEKKPHDRQRILARFGMLDAEKRRTVDEYWQARFSDPGIRDEWQKTIDRIHKHWMDL